MHVDASRNKRNEEAEMRPKFKKTSVIPQLEKSRVECLGPICLARVQSYWLDHHFQ